MTDAPLLHIYASKAPGGEVAIHGSPDALLTLGNALTQAARGTPMDPPYAYTNDGEGFEVLIKPQTPKGFAKLPLPYMPAPVAPKGVPLSKFVYQGINLAVLIAAGLFGWWLAT